MRVRGPAVDGLAAAFAQNWAESGQTLFDGSDAFPQHPHAGQSVALVARGSATVGWNDMSTVFRVVIETARERLRITTAYFVPDPSFQQLLLDAAARGVAVELLLPGPGADKRVCQLASESTYARLQDGGVTIYNFQPSMLHAKVATADGLISILGSANFNHRSMSHDEEVVLAVLDRTITAELDRHFDEDLQRSVKITPRRWRHRGQTQKAAEAASTLLHRWL